MWARQLLRADHDGPDRWVTCYQAEQPGPPPEIRVAAPLRLGQVVTAAESGLVVAELLFDRRLDRGDTIIVEYTVMHQPPQLENPRKLRSAVVVRHPVPHERNAAELAKAPESGDPDVPRCRRDQG
jgi:hypothetical protein